MKKLYKISIQFLVFFLVANSLFAQDVNYWSKSDDSKINKKLITGPTMPKDYEIYQLDEASFRVNMSNVPSELAVYAGNSNKIIAFPTLNGRIERFRIVEAPVMHADLAARYPGINSYAGKGIDNPTATIRFDVSPLGTNAMILYTDNHTVFVDRVEGNYYRVSSRADQNPHTTFSCNTDFFENDQLNLDLTGRGMNATQPKLRTYRLALLSGAEWSAAFFGTATTDAQKKANVLIEQNREMTRANGIFERDFAVRLILVPTNDSIIYLNAATDPITNVNSPNQATCQTAINNKIGANNYDIGHTVTRCQAGQNNGNAGCIGCVCGASSSKGSAFTAYDTPTALDYYVVDYLTHEMGHQMDANHTFSYNDEGSGVQMEPGSGVTIMGYAGITGNTTDIAAHSIDNFHSKSVQQVTAYMYSTTLSNTSAACGVISIVNTNAIPTSNAGSNYIIPRSTPFQLTGEGTDADATDTLSYSWEQIDDNNPAINTTSLPVATYTAGPAFRPYSPTRSNIRIVPQIQYILSGANTTKWEVLPSVARTLNFRLIVRDNHVGCGGNKSDDMAITVNVASGPFKVTSPNTTGISWASGSSQTITWDVANSTAAPVSCAKVKISLSTDGGYTFPIVLSDSTDNDGTETFVIPNNPTTTGRIKVEAVGNIFFDINDKNITVTGLTSGFTFGTVAATAVNCGTTTASVQLPTNSLGGFSTPINLTASNVPAGASVTFGSNPVNPGSPVDITMNNINVLAQGTYSITITGVAGTITQTATVAFVVNPLVPTFTQVAPICTGSSFTLPTTSDNGVTGTWSPAINNTSTTTYTFTPTSNPCASNTTMTVSVTSSILPLFTQVAPVCIGNTFTLPNTSNNNITGTWTPAINNTSTTTYTFIPDAGQCGATTSMTVTVNSTPTVPTFTQVAPICIGGTFTLPSSSTNGISGTWAPAINNQNTTNYTFTPASGSCATTTTMTVSVETNTTPIFNQVAPICVGGSFTLPTSSNNGVTGSWSPSINNTTTTTYTFNPGAGVCATTTTMTVAVNQPTVPTFTQVAAICAGGTYTLPTTSNNSITGNWFPAINNQVTTTYTFVPNQGECATIANMTVTVNQSTVPTFTQVAPICAGSSFILPTTSNNGVIGSWSPSINNQNTTTYTFTPASGVCAATASMTVTVNPVSNSAVNQTACSSYTWNGITYNTSGTYTNSNGCSTDTLHLTINQPSTPTFTQVGAICKGGSFTLPTTSNNSFSGTWSPAVNNQTTTTYTFTPTIGVCATTATMTVTVKQPSTSTSSANVCQTSLPYNWNGVDYTASGTYSKVFAGGNAVGCDSTAILNLVVNTNPVTPSFTQVAGICAGGSFNLPTTSTNSVSGTWNPPINNQATTTYTFTPNAGQCVSNTAVTMTVIVTPVTTTPVSQTSCSSYTWPANGVTYNASGTYTKVTGCNTDILTLTINQPSSSTSSANVCATSLPYVWNGSSYNASGTYSKVYTNGNALGCDSTAFLNLTVNTNPVTPTFTQVAAICAGGTFSLPTTSTNSVSGIWSPAINNQTTTTYTFTPNAGQCVSNTAVTMTVTVNPVNNTSIPRTECNSYVWNGRTYTTSGTYTNSNGCSTDTLYLTIKKSSNSTTNVNVCSSSNFSYSWNNSTYSTAGTYSKVFANGNAVGCDSTAILNLIDTCITIGAIIYPNPTKSGIVTINWANANIKVGTKVQVIVYDRIGRVVSRKTETVSSSVEKDFDLKLKGYSNGLYVVTLEVLYTNYKYSEKIIKQDRD